MNKSNVYLCGDFNVNLMKDNCPKVNHCIDVLHSGSTSINYKTI